MLTEETNPASIRRGTDRLAPAVSALGSSAIRELLSLTRRPGVLSLAGGLPAAETFPAARIAGVTAGLLAADPGAVLQYGPTEGHEPLREWIARYESGRAAPVPDAVPVVADDVIVTAGSQQALDLVARCLVAPGDRVVVEEPAYLGALQVFQAAGARLEPVASDDAGLDVEALARRLAAGLRPAVVHTVATFGNPGGGTLPLDRRRALAALADRYGFTVVEDDPYAELRFAGGPVPPVRAFGADVVTLGSFSKTVAPGLRTGWAVLPRWLQPAVARLKQAADLHAASSSQAVVTELVGDEDWWRAHLAGLRALYAERAQTLVDTLIAAFGDRLEVGRPAGGMFVWGRFTDGTDTRALLPVALGRGVAFVPGAEFFTTPGEGASHLRMSFATNAPALLAEAVERLAGAHSAHSALPHAKLP